MQLIVFYRNRDGSLSPRNPVNQDRLTLAGHQKIRGGDFAAPSENEKISHLPKGFRLWRDGKGMLMAVKEDAK
jgi:hypothetical protein